MTLPVFADARGHLGLLMAGCLVDISASARAGVMSALLPGGLLILKQASLDSVSEGKE